MRKSYFVIMGMLAAGLILSGCEHNPRPKDASSEEKAAAELAEELGDGVEVDGTTVTVKSGETVEVKEGKPVTVDEGVTFIVPESSAISVGSGAEFNVKGAVAVEGGGSFIVENSGTANVEGTVAVESNGSFIVENSGMANVKGAVAVGDGGSFIVENSGTANVTGTVAVESNGSFSVGNNGTANVEGTVAVKSGGNFTVEENGTAAVSGQLTVGSGNTLSNNVNSYNANYQAAAGGNGISALEAEIGDGTLAVKSGGILEVSTGKITVNSGGILDVAGTINIAGAGEMNIENGGVYILQGDAENHTREAGTNDGTVYIKSGGVTHGKGGALDGDGLNVVEVGGKALYTSTDGQTKTMIDGTNSVAGAIFKFTTGTLSFNNWDYILDGNGTLASNFQLYSFRHQKLTVKQDRTLTIASGANLIGQADSSIPTNTTQVVNNGTITFEGGNSNFYPSSGTTAENPAANTIYKWSTTAGGSNAGWKAQASD